MRTPSKVVHNAHTAPLYLPPNEVALWRRRVSRPDAEEQYERLTAYAYVGETVVPVALPYRDYVAPRLQAMTVRAVVLVAREIVRTGGAVC